MQKMDLSKFAKKFDKELSKAISELNYDSIRSVQAAQFKSSIEYRILDTKTRIEVFELDYGFLKNFIDSNAEFQETFENWATLKRENFQKELKSLENSLLDYEDLSQKALKNRH